MLATAVITLAVLGIGSLITTGTTENRPNAVAASTTPPEPSSLAPAASPAPDRAQPTPIPLAPAPAPPATPNSDTGRYSLAAAEALVVAHGYRPSPTTTWTGASGLQVIIGTVLGSADGYDNLAFFFYDNHYLGTDSITGSANIQQLWSDDTTIALSYQLYNSQDPMCCPTGGSATVRYHWTGTHLIPLDPVPPTDPNVSLSRR